MKKLLIVNKLWEEKDIKNALANYVNNEYCHLSDEYCFDYAKYILPLEGPAGIYEKSDSGRYVGHYYDGTLSGYMDKLELKSVDIPDNDKKKTFLIAETTRAYSNDAELERADEVICACSSFDYGILAFAKYLEDHNLDFSKAKYVKIRDLTEKSIIDAIFNEISFQEVFDEMKKRVFC